MVEDGAPVDRRPIGARFPHQGRASKGQGASSAADPSSRFDIVRRGYARDQVDERLFVLESELAELRGTRGERDALLDQVDVLQAHVQQLRLHVNDGDHCRVDDGRSTPTTSNDVIRDKLVRTAEREALMVRATARQEATNIVATARAQAEQERRATEQWIRARLNRAERHVPSGPVEPTAHDKDGPDQRDQAAENGTHPELRSGDRFGESGAG